jgi:hypothetical protein
MTQPMAMDHERGPFSGLLAAQIFFISVTPFVSDHGVGNFFLHVALFGILATSAYVSSSNRSLLIISVAFFALSAFTWLGPDLLSANVEEFLRFGIVGLAFAFTASIVIFALAQHERVTTDTILGGIDAYLLIGCAFAMGHAALMVIDASAYMIGDESLWQVFKASNDSRGFATLLYFSFASLTTLGLGDIAPVNPVARLLTSFEAVVGQLFVAIFIARLVSLEVSQRYAPR